MLTLTRKKGQRIVIELSNGEKVLIDIRKTTPSGTKLGVDAPHSIEINRTENKVC